MTTIQASMFKVDGAVSLGSKPVPLPAAAGVIECPYCDGVESGRFVMVAGALGAAIETHPHDLQHFSTREEALFFGGLELGVRGGVEIATKAEYDRITGLIPEVLESANNEIGRITTAAITASVKDVSEHLSKTFYGKTPIADEWAKLEQERAALEQDKRKLVELQAAILARPINIVLPSMKKTVTVKGADGAESTATIEPATAPAGGAA